MELRQTVLLFLAGLTALIYLPSCSDKRENTQKLIVVLVDKTDQPIIKASYSKALSLIQPSLGSRDNRLSADNKRVEGSLDGSGRVIIAPIWETKHKVSPWEDVTLKKGSLNDTRLQRQAVVRDFLIRLNKGIDEALNSPYGSERSAILYTLDEVAKILAYVNANTKVLLILSDMLEHSDIVSFYGSGVSNDPKQILEQVKSKLPIPDFKGVNIYVLSSSKAADAVAGRVEKFWRLYFAESGGILKQYSVYIPGALE